MFGVSTHSEGLIKMSETIGFIGLGQLGLPMATNLVLATCAMSRTMRSPMQSARIRGTFLGTPADLIPKGKGDNSLPRKRAKGQSCKRYTDREPLATRKVSHTPKHPLYLEEIGMAVRLIFLA